jgi:hypothetical protein
MPRKREIRANKPAAFPLVSVRPFITTLPWWLIFESSRCSKRRLWQVVSPRSQDTVRYGLCISTIKTILGRLYYGLCICTIKTILGRLFGANHGHLEQSGMHLHGIGYGRVSYQWLRSITQVTIEHEGIQQQIAMEISSLWKSNDQKRTRYLLS